jgi:hypothetical protein
MDFENGVSTSKPRTLRARMLPRVVDGPACDRNRVLMPGGHRVVRAWERRRVQLR